jgi:hypothetical protein
MDSTQVRCRNHVVVLEVIILTAAVTLIMSECEKKITSIKNVIR